MKDDRFDYNCRARYDEVVEELKRGDTVILTDYSYSLEIKDGKLVRSGYSNFGECKFTVVGVNYTLPTFNLNGTTTVKNDTIIVGTDGRTIFTRKEFLRRCESLRPLDPYLNIW